MFRPSVRSRLADGHAGRRVGGCPGRFVATRGAGGPRRIRGPTCRSDRGVNQRVADFTLKDVTTDRSISLYSFIGKKAIVLVFLGTDCPVGNLYVPRLIELNRAYRGKGVVFLGINSNAHETEEDVAKFVKETGIDFPVLKDLQNKVSDAVLVERTCEVIVLDGFARIRYRGAIDDQYVQGKARTSPRQTICATRWRPC